MVLQRNALQWIVSVQSMNAKFKITGSIPMKPTCLFTIMSCQISVEHNSDNFKSSVNPGLEKVRNIPVYIRVKNTKGVANLCFQSVF